MIIVPSIYPELFEEIVDKVYIIGTISKLVQINICDGSYGLRVSWSPQGKEILPTSHRYEFDLTLTDWKDYLLRVIKLGAKRVVIHVDEFKDREYEELFSIINHYRMTLGITISNDISVDVLTNAMRKIEESSFFTDPEKVFIQIAGIRNLTENEHPFDERMLARVRIVKKLFPRITIQVSGRITPENVRLIKDAGADRLVVGSYIFGHDDINDAMRLLREAMEQEAKEDIATVVDLKVENMITPIDTEVVDFTDRIELGEIQPETVEEKRKREAYEASKEELVYNLPPEAYLKNDQ